MHRFGLIQIKWFICILACWINSVPLVNSGSTAQSVVAIPFDVTYLLVNGNDNSFNDLNSINQIALASLFKQKLSDLNILQINSIAIKKANQNQSIQCTQNITDSNYPSITLQLLLADPFDQYFESFPTISIQIKRNLYTFQLCSIDIHSTTIVTNMTSGRIYHRSTYISQDNSVLITGGFKPLAVTALITTDKFKMNPGSIPLIPSKNMSVARYDHTADVVSTSGLILIAGGMNSQYLPLNTAELFNPISGVTNTISMSAERATHQSAVIPQSNKIVLIGGQNSSYIPINTGDIYDGTKFTPVKNTMTLGRAGHTVTYLPTINKVLIAGGSNGNSEDIKFFDTVELYDVTTNRFERLPNVRMSSKRAGHTATYIPAPINKVLIVGGGSNETNILDSFDVFDVSTLSFVKSGTMKEKRSFHTATYLEKTKLILLAGGRASTTDFEISTCEIVNPVTMTSTILNCLKEPRFFHTASLISPTDNVFMCGGIDSNRQVLANCERFQLLH